MVDQLGAALLAVQSLAAEPAARPALEQIDPPRRTMVLMALLAFVLLGLVLVACVMIGARWVRQLARHSRGATQITPSLANRRMRESLEPILPSGPTDETTVAERPTDDTVVERGSDER